MKKIILLLIVFVGLYLGGRLALSWNKPNSDSTARVAITIPKGSSLKRISTLLENAELIRDAWVFRRYAKHHDVDRKLQAGEYVIQRNLTYAELIEVLQQGRSSEVKITIPEGYTIAQIDDLLTKRSLIEEGDFVDCAARCDFSFERESLEGFLFPSTYYVSVDSFSSKPFISRLYNTFTQQVAPFASDIQKSGRTMDEIVIVASMIEREAFHDDEMPMISDVIWKRYDEGWHLGIDATTRYELNNWDTPLYTEDFEKETPYNTRKIIGLPPTSISNPGLEAFKAAVLPESNEYYYYLHDTNGQVHFAKTLEGHNANKKKYLR